MARRLTKALRRCPSGGRQRSPKSTTRHRRCDRAQRHRRPVADRVAGSRRARRCPGAGRDERERDLARGAAQVDSSSGPRNCTCSRVARPRADHALECLDEPGRAHLQLLRLVEELLRVGRPRQLRRQVRRRNVPIDRERVERRGRALRPRAASARAPCRSAPATAGSRTPCRAAISVIPWSTGPSWISWSDGWRYVAEQLAELALERLRGRGRRAGRRPPSMSTTSARNGTSSCQNAISRSSTQLAHLRRRPRRPCRGRGSRRCSFHQSMLPGCGSAWKKPSPRICR